MCFLRVYSRPRPIWSFLLLIQYELLLPAIKLIGCIFFYFHQHFRKFKSQSNNSNVIISKTRNSQNVDESDSRKLRNVYVADSSECMFHKLWSCTALWYGYYDGCQMFPGSWSQFAISLILFSVLCSGDMTWISRSHFVKSHERRTTFDLRAL